MMVITPLVVTKGKMVAIMISMITIEMLCQNDTQQLLHMHVYA